MSERSRPSWDLELSTFGECALCGTSADGCLRSVEESADDHQHWIFRSESNPDNPASAAARSRFPLGRTAAADWAVQFQEAEGRNRILAARGRIVVFARRILIIRFCQPLSWLEVTLAGTVVIASAIASRRWRQRLYGSSLNPEH